MSWPEVTSFSNGDSVDADTLNTPIIQLAARTNFLRTAVDTIGNKSGIVLTGIPVSDDISEGNVVYIDSEGKAVKALAKAGISEDDPFTAEPSAYAVGVVTSKDTNTCTILMSGMSESITPCMEDGETFRPGVYYLSAETPGCITAFPCGPKIVVGTYYSSDAGTRAFINIQYRDTSESHVHRRFELPDDGWESVTGDASGASYKYNLSADPYLSKFYPPVPVNAASMTMSGIEVPEWKTGLSDGYEFRDETIFWHGDAPEDVIILNMVKSASCSSGPVTSLSAAQGSPVVVRSCGTKIPSSVGDLELDLDFDASVTSDDDDGNKAYKSFTDGHFTRGPVVSHIIEGGGINVESSSSDEIGKYGKITLSLSSMTHGDFDTIALQNAKQEMIGLFPYIKLLGWENSASIPSAFTSKFQVPLSLASSDYNIKFYATVFGIASSSSTQYAGVNLDYSILPDFTDNPTDNLLNGIISGEQTQMNILFGNGYDAYDPVLITNDLAYTGRDGVQVVTVSDFSAETVKPGYLVALKFSRTLGSPSNYTSPVGFIAVRWAVSKVA